ncbi:MAG: biotin--[acetyl-CoA-carboxylase] ligase [Candidatus Hodarchaeota archaeon]
MFLKIKIVHIDETKSTQDSITEYLKNDYYSSLLLVAKTQTKGRGRKQDDWHSPEGGFWATLGLTTSLTLNESQLALFHYFTATLLSRIIKEEYDLQVQIKWPNDILYENRKLAGILIDYVICSQENYILIGTGVNLNNSSNEMPESLKSSAISIKDILHKPVSIDTFALKICFYANEYYSPIIECNQKKILDLIQEYNQNSRIFGKDAILDDLQKYYCHGINKEGLLQFSNKNSKLNLKIDDLTRIKKIIF